MHWRNPIAHLRRIEADPRQIARGFALGVLLGFTPLFGLKTLLALLFAWWLRGNKVAAVAGVTLHDLATPFIPLLLRLEYDTGFWLLSRPHELPPPLSLHHLSWQAMLNWTTFLRGGVPLLLGLLVIGLPISVAVYLVLRSILARKTA